MALRCKYCDEEFDDILALGRHIGSKHRGEKETPVKRDHYPCPVCFFQQTWTTPVPGHPLTVCPQCLAWYDEVTGALVQPPPEKCIYERSGLPCKAPMHKYYYEQYMAAHPEEMSLT